ncbi:MAG: nucleoside deaminase [Mariniblastus sp.]|nr:nucleoside deaminase [Mariniblastus sp.]
MMSFEVSLPQWAVDENRLLPEFIPDVEQRMREVIRFAELNLDKKTGGPFAAGIFEKNSGKVVGIGVNRVVPSNNSSAHAEIVAISLAQTKLATFDLGGPGMPDFQIVVNGRPCAMCCGALPWSGVRSLVIGASGERIESLTGFDEGAVHPNWQQELEARGIEVIENVLAKEAEVVFQRFRDSDEPVYNGRSGDALK